MSDTNRSSEPNVQETPSTDELIESVRELIGMMTSSGISELDLTAGDVSIRLRSQSGSSAGQVVHVPVAATQSGVPIQVAEEPVGKAITSPMIGTFYSAPAPGESAFVQVGDEVEVGQTIGIIEAMKIMNEITADHAGVIAEILVENAQPVEYGSPLMRVVDSDPIL